MTKDKIPIQNKQAPSGACSPHKALTLDSSLYEKYLEESDLSKEQKQEFLETLWSIIVSFVDLGFEVHPLQQAISKSCGQKDEIGEFIASYSDFVVDSKDTNSSKSIHPEGSPQDTSKARSQ